MRSKIKQLGLQFTYNVLSVLTKRIRSSRAIQLKIGIGMALLCAKEAKAQNIEFPNKVNQSDTLELNVDLESESITLCYEVVVVKSRMVEPKVRGGQRALNRFVQENVIYPKEALEHKIEGDVAVNIEVDKEGKVLSAYVIQKIGYGLDEEAVRLAKQLPEFRAGKINRKKSKMNKTIVFHFELPKK
jgi:protein TonB